MNPELLALALPVGKYILAAALMVVFYWFLFREKATFNNCRLYLLSIALVAILISQFSIVVYTPPAEIVEIEAVQTMPIISDNHLTTSQAPVLAANPKPAEKVAEPNKYLVLLTVKNIALAVYIIVTSVLFVLLFVQLFRILALKRRGKLTVKDGFAIVESAEIPTPFSFYKTIFLSQNLTGSKLEMILKHEQWHIKHRHYLDVFIIEILVRLFWFNPVLWWVRRELRNVSEFHADRSVLDEGQNLYKYQTVILEEVMENNPYLANGFNNSFTRKRFIMMKNKCHIRFATLRRVLSVPFLVVAFSLFSFSIGKSEVRYVEKQSEEIHSQNSLDKVESKLEIPKASSLVTNSKDSILPVIYNTAMHSVGNRPITKDEITNSLNTASIQLSTVVNLLDKLTANYKTSDLNNGLISVLRSIGLNPRLANNGKFSFSTELISSITKDDLKNASANFSEIRKKIDALKNEAVDTALVNRFKSQARNMLTDKLVFKLFKDGSSQDPGVIFSTSPPVDVKNTKSTAPKRSIDENINYQSNLFDDLIQRMEKLIAANNIHALREGLFEATNLTSPSSSFRFSEVFSEKFCSDVTLDEMKNCLAEYRKLKEEIKQLRKLETDEAKTKGLNEIFVKLRKIDLVRRSSQENSRIRNERNQTVAKDYYKNYDN